MTESMKLRYARRSMITAKVGREKVGSSAAKVGREKVGSSAAKVDPTFALDEFNTSRLSSILKCLDSQVHVQI